MRWRELEAAELAVVVRELVSGRTELADQLEIFEEKALPLIERQVNLTYWNLDVVCRIFAVYAKKKRQPGPALLQVMEKEVVQAMSGPGSAAVQGASPVTIIFYCAQMGWKPGDEMMACLTERICASMIESKAQIISNTLWGYATLGVDPGGGLMGTLERCALLRLGQGRMSGANFQPNQISAMLWAYATLGKRPSQELLSALEKQSILLLRRFNLSDIADTAWAYATLGMSPGERLVPNLEARAVTLAGKPSNAHEFPGPVFAKMMQAFETLGWQTSDALLMIGRGEVFRTPPPQLDSTYPHLHR